MPYNDAQLFYAAMYWISALPGADAYMADACKARRFDVVDYKAPRSEDELRDPISPLTKEQFDTILTTLEQELTKPDAVKNFTSDGTATSYQEVRRSLARVFPPRPPTTPAEIALAAAGIDDEGAAKISTVYLHETGQLFAYMRQDDKLVVDELIYPGRPEMPFTSHPKFSVADMTNDGQFVFEQFYRIERLEKDEKYIWSYDAVNGKRVNLECSNLGQDVITVSGADPKALAALTREDILSGTVANSPDDQKRFSGNYMDPGSKERMDATEFPGIYRELRGPFNYMTVKEPTQLYSGSSFMIAQPGDRIFAEKDTSTPRVIRADKHHLMKPYRKPEGGVVRFKPKP